jgi:hypothetical protein
MAASVDKAKKASGPSKPKSPPSHPPFLEVFLPLLKCFAGFAFRIWIWFVFVLDFADDYGRDCDSEGEDGFESVRDHEGHWGKAQGVAVELSEALAFPLEEAYGFW